MSNNLKNLVRALSATVGGFIVFAIGDGIGSYCACKAANEELKDIQDKIDILMKTRDEYEKQLNDEIEDLKMQLAKERGSDVIFPNKWQRKFLEDL